MGEANSDSEIIDTPHYFINTHAEEKQTNKKNVVD